MKFLVAYSSFSLMAAAMPTILQPSEAAVAAPALPSEAAVAVEAVELADGDKAKSSSLLDRLSKGKEGDKPEAKSKGKGKEDKPEGKSKGKGKEDKPESKSSGAKDLLDKLQAKANEAKNSKPDPPKGKESKGKEAPAPKPAAGGLGSLMSGGVRCGPVAVLFSRGTFEIGAQGMAVGSPFTTALQAVLPSGTVFWGNEYTNDVIGYLTGGSVQGSMQMKNKAQDFVAKCPGIKLVLGGYSQGAQVTHHALESANAQTKAAVKAVVLFGDPLSGRPIPGVSKDRVKTICGAGDTICWGLPVVTLSHMTYGATDSASAAAWVRTKINT